MFCMHCGKQINEKSAFCSICGKPQQAQTSITSPNTAATQIAATSVPHGTTIVSLDRSTLLETIRVANSVITAYMEAIELCENFDNFQQWCFAYHKESKKFFNPKFPSLAEYGLDLDFLNNFIAKKGHTSFGKPLVLEEEKGPMNRGHIEALVKHTVKNNDISPDIDEAKRNLKIAENNLHAKIEYVNLISPNYRYPLALDEIYSYLADHRAESWKEAVNLYEEQLHRWQLELNSEEAILLQAQTAALAAQAASSAGTAALFSGLSFFLK